MKKNYKKFSKNEETTFLPKPEVLVKILNYSKVFSRHYLQELVNSELKTSKLN